MAANAEHRGSWTQHGAPCKVSHRSCPPAERPPRAILPSHLMLGCSCASMSPPLSFFSRGTTTPTAPSAAASSRFSSAPSNKGGGGFSAARPGAACRRRCSTHSRLRRPCLGPASVMTRHCVLRAHSCARGCGPAAAAGGGAARTVLAHIQEPPDAALDGCQVLERVLDVPEGLGPAAGLQGGGAGRSEPWRAPGGRPGPVTPSWPLTLAFTASRGSAMPRRCPSWVEVGS